MTIHVSPTTGCNLGCSYCYENPDRERKQEWVDRQYDMDKIMDALSEWKEEYPNETPGLHGGEPLLVRTEDLETIFSYVDEHWDGTSHIQTNGTLMKDEHIELFEEYEVGVGISVDGPVELNRLRKAAAERDEDSTRATDNASERTLSAIERCAEGNFPVNIIVVLSEANAGSEEKLEKLLEFLDEMNKKGVRGHFNPAIPYEDISEDEDVALGRERLKEVYLRAWEWMKEEPYREFGPMSYYVDNLMGNRLTNCVNNKCDVGNAGAAKIIEGDGESTGCGKTWSQYGDGGSFLQGPSTDNEYNDDEERYEVLKQTPGWVTEGEPDMGGCKGCKYWNVCQGGCPSAGQNDDYRNRTHFCQAKYALYAKVEEDLRTILPNIRLITDLPWNAEVADHASGWQLDIKPFAAMRPGVDGKSSAGQGYNHPFGSAEDQVPDELIPDRGFEESLRHAREQYDEEVLTHDRQEKTWHADSDIRHKDNQEIREDQA
jgi:uncharacterized protein